MLKVPQQFPKWAVPWRLFSNSRRRSWPESPGSVFGFKRRELQLAKWQLKVAPFSDFGRVLQPVQVLFAAGCHFAGARK
jgi:hypothetical protein